MGQVEDDKLSALNFSYVSARDDEASRANFSSAGMIITKRHNHDNVIVVGANDHHTHRHHPLGVIHMKHLLY